MSTLCSACHLFCVFPVFSVLSCPAQLQFCFWVLCLGSTCTTLWLENDRTLYWRHFCNHYYTKANQFINQNIKIMHSSIYSGVDNIWRRLFTCSDPGMQYPKYAWGGTDLWLLYVRSQCPEAAHWRGSHWADSSRHHHDCEKDTTWETVFLKNQTLPRPAVFLFHHI